MTIGIDLLRKDKGGDPEAPPRRGHGPTGPEICVGKQRTREENDRFQGLVKESEKRRFRDPKLIDQVLELDTLWVRNANWVKQKFQLDEKRKEASTVNKVQSQITEKKKASKGADKCEDLLEQKTSLEGEAANMEKVCDETIFQRVGALNELFRSGLQSSKTQICACGKSNEGYEPRAGA
ncbi:unnamed protein product [Durusdinium trenchii]|uniref:Uncharacterized protein n=1 Tax=Durusdinium trenchii TaxID=1381693 RepID=A0ABP0S7K1_9DINO